MKTPVIAKPYSNYYWEVEDADGSLISACVERTTAEEIARRINAHDALVTALEGVIAVADRKTVEFDNARSALTAARGE